MFNKSLALIIILGSQTLATPKTCLAEPEAVPQDIKLSPDVQNLLQAEMGEIAGGIQGIALSLATADWVSIQETSKQIQASYIMEKKLSATQARELEQALPEHFRQIDAEFHRRAGKLAAAAAAHDPELAAFHYSRLLESCASCHSAYAKTRFPGFTPPDGKSHSH